jgi:hypothetical protein
MCGFQRAPSVELQRQPQLIAKLFREPAVGETSGDTGDELPALFRTQFTMLQAAAHQGTRPAMPKPFRLCEHEFNAFFDCIRSIGRARCETASKIIKFPFA